MPGLFYFGLSFAILICWFIIFSGMLNNYEVLNALDKKVLFWSFGTALIASLICLILGITSVCNYYLPHTRAPLILSAFAVCIAIFCIFSTSSDDE